MTVEGVRSLVFAAVAAMAGLGFVIPNAIAVRRGLAAERWIRTRGRIQKSSITIDSYVQDRDATRGPTVLYSYEAHDGTHQGTRISFARAVPVMSRWTQPFNGLPPDVLAGLRAKTEVDVWYDPEDPAQAVLRPGVDGAYIGLILLGTLLLTVSATLVHTAYSL